MDEPDSPDRNPMQHPDEQSSGGEGAPRFGMLLLVLAIAVGLVVAVTFLSLAWITG